MKLHWHQLSNGDWRLSPSMLTVRKSDWHWNIFVGDCPMVARYTSEQGAKLDAWQYMKGHCKALLGAYSIELTAEITR